MMTTSDEIESNINGLKEEIRLEKTIDKAMEEADVATMSQEEKNELIRDLAASKEDSKAKACAYEELGEDQMVDPEDMEEDEGIVPDDADISEVETDGFSDDGEEESAMSFSEESSAGDESGLASDSEDEGKTDGKKNFGKGASSGASIFKEFSYHQNKTKEEGIASARRLPRRAAAKAAAKSFNEDEIESRYWKNLEDSDSEEDEEINESKDSKNNKVQVKPPKLQKKDKMLQHTEPSDDASLRRSARSTKLNRKIVDISASEDSEEEQDRRPEKPASKNEKDNERSEDTDPSSDSEVDASPKDPSIIEDTAEEDINLDIWSAAERVERILAQRPSQVNLTKDTMDIENMEYRIKVNGRSFRESVWVPRAAIVQAGRVALLRAFEKRANEGSIDPYGDLEDGVHPDWLCIDRIISDYHLPGFGHRYLVKWRGLSYSDSTWESESALKSDEDETALNRYKLFSNSYLETIEKLKTEGSTESSIPGNPKSVRDNNEDGDVNQGQQGTSEDVRETETSIDTSLLPEFCNGRQLRDYQKDSLQWMVKNWAAGRNCILGDEMGLGKTAQSIAVLSYQLQIGKTKGPFLVIAPLTTLGHWQKEIEVWSKMNCVVYSGNVRDREILRHYELWPLGRGSETPIKPDVVLSSYEMVLRDSSIFQSITWETIVVDEAHRMKGTTSATRNAIANCSYGWLLLLSGTPVQNNMKELFGLMNLLDPETYDDQDEFLENFGDDTNGRSSITPEQVRALQHALRPILLRRMKEDVETLPEKEECIIWTQLTAEQRVYYRAIFERRIDVLMAGSKAKNTPKLRNVAMELRKVCCHPFLCDGIEDDYHERKAAAGERHQRDQIESLVQSSGKMLLLHKLLPKLQKEGHKVLIFSQFKIMLDLLEDYLRLSKFPCERIDGSTSSRDRQAAIDRYSRPGSDGFVFLLSTRAGGQGITLTSADTCIIYDSDWNPQNDLQAMARCHRIGQDKDVTIYRLVSKGTYEEHVFRTSSRKYGLDEAILGGISDQCKGDPEADAKRLSELLKHGAMALAASETEAAAKETEDFETEDIDSILRGRTEKRVVGGRAGNTFSVATFEVAGGGHGFNDSLKDSSNDDTSFWSNLLPEAAAADAAKKSNPVDVILVPRRRKRVNYAENMYMKRAKTQRRHSDGYSSDVSDFENYADNSNSENENGKSQKRRGRSAANVWNLRYVDKFLDQLLRYGFSRYRLAAEKAQLPSAICGEQDLIQVSKYLKEAIIVATEIITVPSNAFSKSKASPSTKDAYQGTSSSVSSDKENTKSKSSVHDDINDSADKDKAIDTMKCMIEAELKELLGNMSNSMAVALQSRDIMSRIIRNAVPYETHAAAMEKLCDLWGHNSNERDVFNKNQQLRAPKISLSSKSLILKGWQIKDHDVELLRACYVRGYPCPGSRKMKDDVGSLLKDRRFSFYNFILPPEEETTDAESSEVLNATFENDSGEKGAEYPSDKENVKPGHGASSSRSHIVVPRMLDMKEWDKVRKETMDRIKALLSSVSKKGVSCGSNVKDPVQPESARLKAKMTTENCQKPGTTTNPTHKASEIKEYSNKDIKQRNDCIQELMNRHKSSMEKSAGLLYPRGNLGSGIQKTEEALASSPSDSNNMLLTPAPPISQGIQLGVCSDLKSDPKPNNPGIGLASVECNVNADLVSSKSSSVALASKQSPPKSQALPTSKTKKIKKTRKNAGQKSLFDMMKFGLKPDA